jgi:uncharacterized protein YidB (DUF937 family)
MGLLDVLNGMQNGPRGQRGGPSAAPSSGGMSPITMAILGLLAYKAVKSFGANQAGAAPAGKSAGPTAIPANDVGGGFGDLLKGGLGGLLAGGAAGSILSGGLNDLLKQFQQGGQADVANSWVGTGPNKTVPVDALAKVLDSDQVKMLMEQTGLSRDALMSALSEALPGVVDHLTPNGRLPTENEISRLL